MSTEPIKLSTDFVDYPDEAFEKKGIEFERYRHSRISRQDSLDFLKNNGYNTPNYGLPRDVIPKIVETRQTEKFCVVVHIDPFDHSEFNKQLVSAKEAFDKYSKYFCVEYLPIDETSPTSYRYLKIGMLDFGLVYSSNDTWKSNCGGVEVRIACSGDDRIYHSKMNFPLFSIDYIKSNGILYAIDLDLAPVLKHTGIELMLTPKQVYEEISEAVKHFS